MTRLESDMYGAEPPLDLTRQLLELERIYSTERNSMKSTAYTKILFTLSIII